MSEPRLRLSTLPGRLAACRLPAGDPLPGWAWIGPFTSITRTLDELSVIVDESAVPDGIQADRGWACFKLEGPFPFTAVGVLSALASPLARARIPLLAVSTFDTDYLLVRADDLPAASEALRRAGHVVEGDATASHDEHSIE